MDEGKEDVKKRQWEREREVGVAERGGWGWPLFTHFRFNFFVGFFLVTVWLVSIKAPFGKQYHAISSDVVAMTLLHLSEPTKLLRGRRIVQIGCWWEQQTKVFSFLLSFFLLVMSVWLLVTYWWGGEEEMGLGGVEGGAKRETGQSENAFELRGKLELFDITNESNRR